MQIYRCTTGLVTVSNLLLFWVCKNTSKSSSLTSLLLFSYLYVGVSITSHSFDCTYHLSPKSNIVFHVFTVLSFAIDFWSVSNIH